MSWLQMPCPRGGAVGTGLGPRECGAPQKPKGGSQTHQDHLPGALVGEGLQLKDLCDCSEVRGQHGGSTGPWVCMGGGGRGRGTEKAEPDPQEDALSSQTRRGRFRCRPRGRAQE